MASEKRRLPGSNCYSPRATNDFNTATSCKKL